jgi:hypothetical protein
MAYLNGPQIVRDGLVLYLDAGNRRSYPGSGTTWTDLTGNGNNGTLTNGPTFNSGNGGSIVFDGVNDYVNNTFSFSTRPFSINGWLLFNSLSGWQTLVGQDTSQATPLGSIYFQKINSGGSGDSRVANTFGMALITTANLSIYCYDEVTVTTGIWYNYCISVSTTDMKLYKNGNLVQTVANSDNLATTTGNTIIGAGIYNTGVVDFINGNIAQVSVYNRALTALEVTQNYNALRSRFGV